MCFLVSLAPNFKYHWICQALLKGKFELAVTKEILTEYYEQITIRYGLLKTDFSLDYLLLLPNIKFTTPFFLLTYQQFEERFKKLFDS